MPFAVAGAVAGSAISASGASDAANAAAQQAAAQLAWEKEVYNQFKGQAQPYIDYGQSQLAAMQKALPSLESPYTMEQYKQSPLYTPMVTNLAELQSTPGYKFQLQQGLQGVGQSAAARGGLLSGAAAKAMNDYAQNQAATGFQNAWQRAQTAYGNAFNQNLAQNQQLYNMYNTGAQTGLSAANQVAAIGSGGAISNAYQNLGNAQAAQAAAPYAAWNQGIGNIGSALGSAYQSGNLSSLGNSIGSLFGSGNMGNVVSPISQQTLQSQFANAPAFF